MRVYSQIVLYIYIIINVYINVLKNKHEINPNLYVYLFRSRASPTDLEEYRRARAERKRVHDLNNPRSPSNPNNPDKKTKNETEPVDSTSTNENECQTFLTSPLLIEFLRTGSHIPIPELAEMIFTYIGKPFISTWAVGVPDRWNEEYPMYIRLPLARHGLYDFVVDWGDGSTDHIGSFDQAEVKHEYAYKGAYVVQCHGILNGFSFSATRQMRVMIIDISLWGCVGLEQEQGKHFAGCVDLNVTASDAPNLAGVKSLYNMFSAASSFSADVSHWVPSSATDVRDMFSGVAASFDYEGPKSWTLGRLIHPKHDDMCGSPR